MMVRGILKEVSDEAVEIVGRREELESELEVILKVIEEEQKKEGGKTVKKKDKEEKGLTRSECRGKLRTRKNAKGKFNKRRNEEGNEQEIKITSYYKRKGGEESLPNKVVARDIVEEIVSVGWELFCRRERARMKMWAWKSAGSIVENILEMTVMCGKLPECGTELSCEGKENPDVLDDHVWACPEGGMGLSHFQDWTVLKYGGAECEERLRHSQDCLSVTEIKIWSGGMQNKTECGFGLRHLVGQSLAESRDEPMDISVMIQKSESESKAPECRNELSVGQRPSVEMGVGLDMDKGARGGELFNRSWIAFYKISQT